MKSEHLQAGSHPGLWQRLMGYLQNGCVVTAVHFAVLWGLVTFGAWHPVWATSVAFLVGAVLGFCLNRHRVFKQTEAGWRALGQYILLSASTGVLNALEMKMLYDYFAWHYLLAQAVATLSVVLINFTVCQTVIFATPRS